MWWDCFIASQWSITTLSSQDCNQPKSDTLCQRVGSPLPVLQKDMRPSGHLLMLPVLHISWSFCHSYRLLEMVRTQQDFFLTFSKILGSTHFWLHFIPPISRHPSQVFRGRKMPRMKLLAHCPPTIYFYKCLLMTPNLLSSFPVLSFLNRKTVVNWDRDWKSNVLVSLPKPKHLSYLPNHLSRSEGNHCLIPTLSTPFHQSYKGSLVSQPPKEQMGGLRPLSLADSFWQVNSPPSVSKHNALLSASSALGYPASHSTMHILRHRPCPTACRAHPAHTICKTLTAAATMPKTAWGTLLIMKVGDTSGSSASQPKTQVTTGCLRPPFYYVARLYVRLWHKWNQWLLIKWCIQNRLLLRIRIQTLRAYLHLGHM